MTSHTGITRPRAQSSECLESSSLSTPLFECFGCNCDDFAHLHDCIQCNRLACSIHSTTCPNKTHPHVLCLPCRNILNLRNCHDCPWCSSSLNEIRDDTLKVIKDARSKIIRS